MAFTLPSKAEIEAALTSLDSVLADLAPFEAFLPSTVQTGLADAQKVIGVLEAAANALP
jgi:hypothetical protein